MGAAHGLPLSAAELLQGLGLAFILGRFLPPYSPKGSKNRAFPFTFSLCADSIKTAGFLFIFVAAKAWLALVDRYVPEPYLDEVFHIPQAQTYCGGRFRDWDDKITTPPGLYLLSVAYHKFWMIAKCTPLSLRSNNLLATLLTALLASQCRHLIEARAAEREGRPVSGSLSLYAYHTGVNIALFPVIFFFSALYYTDVVSTLVVLVAYRNHLLRLGPCPPSAVNDLWTVVLGIAALLMRQTNVFWVVVYMGGMEAVHVLRSVKPGAQEYLTKLHDPPLDQSGPEDWLFCGLTIVVTALLNPFRVLRQIWPHIGVLAVFAGFVAWNGGVVLGDKSNHIATIHLAQMLYIWPLFAFFSAPLLLPSILATLSRPVQYIQSLLSLHSKRASLISIPYNLLTILVSLAVVRYNTIIHPFTLADNRHYMFYVFRHTILRSPAIRLSLVAAYTLARWLVWDQLAGTSHHHHQTQQQPAPKPRTQAPTSSSSTAKVPSSSQPANPLTAATATVRPLTLLDSPSSSSSTAPPTSTALLWLLTTALSLITAPLVEPRYFILPWVFYRLLVPAWSLSPLPSAHHGFNASNGKKGGGKKEKKKDSNAKEGDEKKGAVWLCLWLGWLERAGRKIDVRLGLETVWFLVVNAGTMYVFLKRGFYWRGPEGEVLDGGRVQRFMW